MANQAKALRPAPVRRVMSRSPMPPRRQFIPPLGPPRLSQRERVLAQWHGVHLAPLEKAATPARSLEALMPGVLRDLGIDRRRSETEILQVWNHLIDPTLTAHAQPAGLVRGTLFVNVDSSVWLEEIVRYRRREILERLQHSFGRELVRKIAFRVG